MNVQRPATVKGPWEVECAAGDGGRISRLSFDGRELLTGPPVEFCPPASDYGAYEERPVYGYDDCLPTVVACEYPGTDWTVPDHGELCWLPWEIEETDTGLLCRVTSRELPLRFERELILADNLLTWRFRAGNTGESALEFQHVMHPLMPLDRVSGIELPACGCAVEEETRDPLDGGPGALAAQLLGSAPRKALMWMLQDTSAGAFRIELDGDLCLDVRYDHSLFPTLGIWWNRDGYPGEDGCRRNECAFEPIPGPTSMLSEAHAAGGALCVAPGDTLNWNVEWTIG